MWDACVCYEIELDEGKIIEDGIYSLEKIYAFMDKAFEVNDCSLEKTDGNMRVYVRSVDNKDLQCMWMAVKQFDESEWFENYACRYMFYIYDTEDGEIEEEEDWLVECGILKRRGFRERVKEITNKMIFVDEDVTKELLKQSSYQCIETEDFILYHKKSMDNYKNEMFLISVSLEQHEMTPVAALICLMQMNELTDSVVIAFLKRTKGKREGVQSLVKLLKKAKKTFRAITLDVTNTGWEEECDFTVENCYLTQRMYKNLVSVLHGGRHTWKIIPEDRQMLKGILFDKKYFTENLPRRNECDYYKECGVYSFSFCLPVGGDIIRDEAVTIDTDRLGWYMDKLRKFGKRKI